MVAPIRTLSFVAIYRGVIRDTSNGVAYSSDIREGEGQALAVEGANGEKWVRPGEDWLGVDI